MFCNKCGSELNENGECLNCKRKEESEKSKLENEIKPKIKKKKVKKKKTKEKTTKTKNTKETTKTTTASKNEKSKEEKIRMFNSFNANSIIVFGL